MGTYGYWAVGCTTALRLVLTSRAVAETMSGCPSVAIGADPAGTFKWIVANDSAGMADVNLA